MSADAESLKALLTAIAGGDRGAFQRLYHATSSHLFAVLLRILRDRAQAEEALQESYVRIWQKAASFDSKRGEPRSWMAAIARHRALDMLRRARPAATTDALEDHAEIADSAVDVVAEAEDDVALELLHQCLRELSTEQRQAVMLAYYEGFSHGELAGRLRQPLGTVKSRIRRGLLRLRECLQR